MEFFQKILKWFGSIFAKKEEGTCEVHHKEATTKKYHCEHGTTDHAFEIVVLGKTVKFKGSPLCIPCTEKYMNKFSTYCALCDEPILPWMAVGCGGIGSSHPYAHLECSGTAVYCGQWGEGRLIGLDELHQLKMAENNKSTTKTACSECC